MGNDIGYLKLICIAPHPDVGHCKIHLVGGGLSPILSLVLLAHGKFITSRDQFRL